MDDDDASAEKTFYVNECMNVFTVSFCLVEELRVENGCGENPQHLIFVL